MRLPHVLTALLVLFFAASVPAKPGSGQSIVANADSSLVVRILGEQGFAGSTVDEDGDIVVRMSGYRVIIVRSASGGTELSFRSAFTGTKANLETVNEWNKRMKYTKAYLDNDGDPVLEMDLDLAGGVTEDRIADAIRTFNGALGQFVPTLS